MKIGSPSGETPERGRPENAVIPSALETRQRIAELADRLLHAEWRRQQESPEASSKESIGSDRVAGIARARHRVASGFYDRPEVKEQIAEKLSDKLSFDKDRESGGKE